MVPRPWTDDFVDIEGDKKPPPRFRTRVKMLWDDRHFYVAAELEEPDVWSYLTDHDAVLFHDLDFEVFLDPDGDNHDYAELEINALGTTWDLLLNRPYRDAGKATNAFEFEGLKSAVHVAGTLNHPGDRDEGWTVEIAFPWSSLPSFAHVPCPPRDGDQWRLNFCASSGGTACGVIVTSRSPTPRTTGSGRPRERSRCTCPSGGAMCSSPPPRAGSGHVSSRSHLARPRSSHGCLRRPAILPRRDRALRTVAG